VVYKSLKLQTRMPKHQAFKIFFQKKPAKNCSAFRIFPGKKLPGKYALLPIKCLEKVFK